MGKDIYDDVIEAYPNLQESLCRTAMGDLQYLTLPYGDRARNSNNLGSIVQSVKDFIVASPHQSFMVGWTGASKTSKEVLLQSLDGYLYSYNEASYSDGSGLCIQYDPDEVLYEESLTDNIATDCKTFLVWKGYDPWSLTDIIFDKGVNSPHGMKRQGDKIQGDFLDFFNIDGMENKKFVVKDQYGYLGTFSCDANQLKEVLRKGFEDLNTDYDQMDREYYIEYDN